MIRERILRSRLMQECCVYSYEKCVGEDEIRRLLFTFRQDFPEQTAAVLTAGCVKLNAVLYLRDGRIHLGCDLYVKDSPDSAEWIFYEALCDTGGCTACALSCSSTLIVERADCFEAISSCMSCGTGCPWAARRGSAGFNGFRFGRCVLAVRAFMA